MANLAGFAPCFVAGRKQKHFRFRDEFVHNITDDDFVKRYRFKRETMEFISDVVSEDVERGTKRNKALSPFSQVLIFLRYVASGSFFEVVGDTIAVEKSTVSRTVHRVAEALCKKRDRFIRWPVIPAEKQKNREDFFRLGGFPRVNGCVDGTHVRIIAPSDDENAFVNRKHYHSINVQGICDAQGLYIFVCIQLFVQSVLYYICYF